MARPNDTTELARPKRVATQDTPRIERICEYDGVVFYVEPFKLKRSPCRWCSRACFNKSNRTGEERICATCGKKFYVGGSALGHRPSEWCSMACSRISQRRGLHRECRTCGKTFYVQNGHLKKSPTYGFYCSETCKGPRMAEIKGSVYRGGPYRAYGGNWNAQANKARKRDGYTCQDCGLYQIKPRLHVHHLVSRRSFGGDFDQANVLENLITLCVQCHIIREHVFGKIS